MNLIVNSREPHPPVEAPWSEEHLAQSGSASEAAHRLWVIEKGYDPVQAAIQKLEVRS